MVDKPTDAAFAAPVAPAASAAQDARPTPGQAGPPQTAILDSAATRQAIIDAARAPSLAQLPGTSPPAGQTQRLGSAMAAGAHGDCDKGEYVGGGMGLLSLPFWAAAKLRGDCGR